MFNLPRRNRKPDAVALALGVVQVPVTPNIRSVIERLGQRWRCSTEIAAQRIIVMSLTGWPVRYADLLGALSRFVPGQDDPFRRTCQLLCSHFDTAEVQLGEAVKECDRVAWLETLLETLKERKMDGDRAVLSDVLADAPLGAS
ncbi:MAG: hypothetical protein ACYTG1_12680 [Planctomycetota bacterium]|jgi:hypothetical protein